MPAVGAHQRGAGDRIGERHSWAPWAVQPLGLCPQCSAPTRVMPVGDGCHTLSPYPALPSCWGGGTCQHSRWIPHAWKRKDAPVRWRLGRASSTGMAPAPWHGMGWHWDHPKVPSSVLQDARGLCSSRAEGGGWVGTGRVTQLCYLERLQPQPFTRDQTCPAQPAPPHPSHAPAPRGTLWVARGLWGARCLLILLPEPLSLSLSRALSGAVGAGSSCQRSQPDVGAARKRAWRV